jgi:ABC-type cobalamin/Fe3+-siderophores transport system ATPase subunit
MIRFDEISIRYPTADTDAVAGVSFEARRGTLTAVVGPNGSGKSTLVRALLGRIPARSGGILLDERPIAELPRRDVARRVAVIPQREELAFPALVAEYVALGRFPHVGLWHAAGDADRDAMQRAMTLTGVAPLRDRRVDTLSGGEWQRVRLARALAQSAEALVLDEPTAFLDVGHEMEAFELLHLLAREGRAVMLVSHQLNLVARFADLIVLLHRGRIASVGAPADVMQAATLEHVYDWPLVITRDPAVGAPALVPLRSRPRH